MGHTCVYVCAVHIHGHVQACRADPWIACGLLLTASQPCTWKCFQVNSTLFSAASPENNSPPKMLCVCVCVRATCVRVCNETLRYPTLPTYLHDLTPKQFSIRTFHAKIMLNRRALSEHALPWFSSSDA